MTDRLHDPPVGSYMHGPHKLAHCMDEGLSTKKTVIVLMIIGACFAILWPKIFYPMLVGTATGRMKPHRGDTGCCDVISELDLDTIKIMSELCSTIIESKETKPLTGKEIVRQCRKAVLETCGIDIEATLQDRVSLGHSTKQILEEVRSLNGSLCLKYHFGVAPWKLGVPHRGAGAQADPTNNIRQERSSQLRPGVIHPAFRERGRAIPEAQAESLPRRTGPPPRIIEGRPGPIPGMRPTIGGPGHVVAPSKQSNYGFMGVLMPLYTIGFVIFFAYTIMKLVFKKKPETYSGAPLYPPCDTDDDFRHEVFDTSAPYFDRPNKDNSKIVVNAVAALLEEVNKEIEAHKSKTPSDSSATEQEILKPNGTLPKEEDQGSITVMGMETTASSESGKKWSRPDSPVLPHPQPVSKEASPPPQQIFLETALPPQSQILVSELGSQKDSEDDSPVVLAGKMTLSVISLDSENGTEDSGSGSKKADSDEERRTSSSNVSEEFEKVTAADLEEEDPRVSPEKDALEERIAALEKSIQEVLHPPAEEDFSVSPVVTKEETSGGVDVLEEMKQQLHLEDDLLEVLQQENDQLDASVADIINQFLNDEVDDVVVEEREDARPQEDDFLKVQFRKDEVDDKVVEEKEAVEKREVVKESEDDSLEVVQQENRQLDASVAGIINRFLKDKAVEEREDERPPEDDSLEVLQRENRQLDASVAGIIPAGIIDQFLKDEVVEEKEAGKEREVVEERDDARPLEVLQQENNQLDASVSNIINELLKDEVDDVVVEEREAVEQREDARPSEDAVQPPEDTIRPSSGRLFRLGEPSMEEILREELQRNEASRAGGSFLDDPIEQVIEEIQYEDDDGDDEDEDEDFEEEERRLEGERRVNGVASSEGSSRNGAERSETAAENEISENELDGNEEDEEIEEIIEYVDNTDEEGEEVIEVNGNEGQNRNGGR